MKNALCFIFPKSIHFRIRIAEIALTRSKRNAIFPVMVFLNYNSIDPVCIKFNIKTGQFGFIKIDYIMSMAFHRRIKAICDINGKAIMGRRIFKSINLRVAEANTV